MIIEQKLLDIQARAKDIETKMNSGDVSGDELTKLLLSHKELSVNFKKANSRFKKFHIVATFTTSFRIFAERLSHSDFVHRFIFLMT